MNNSEIQWHAHNGGIRIAGTRHMDLNKILDCGQCFRWRYADGVWKGTVGSRVLEVRSWEGKGWFLENCTNQEFQDFWVPYFDGGRSYGQMEALYAGMDQRLDMALDLGRGIRILRQPFWETTVSFVLSANNNIPRIQGMIDRLCQAAGSLLPSGDYTFPGADAVALLNEGDFRAMGFGYRAPFIVRLAEGFASGRWTEEMFTLGTTAEVRKNLLGLPGVGPKVADCILLFALGRMDAFPVDTWIKKVLAALDSGKSPEGGIMSCMAESPRCEAAGYVQQVLFYSARYQKWEV